MNWAGDLAQKEIGPEDIVLELGCGIMQATLDVIPAYPKTRLQCKRLIGVDIYDPYLDFLKERGVETVKWDLTKTPLPFEDKSVDVILLYDILEHLEKFEYVEQLITESERIARKKILVITPRIFFENVQACANSYEMGTNVHQQHHLLITEKFLKKKGFDVYLPRGDLNYFFAVKRVSLRILHVWDAAGVARVLAKYQRRLGHQVKCIYDSEYDTYGYQTLYEDTTDVSVGYEKIALSIKEKYIEIIKTLKVDRLYRIYRGIKRRLKIVVEIMRSDSDILHVHVLWWIPLVFPFRASLIELHGTTVRKKMADGTVNTKRNHPDWAFRLYRALGVYVYYSTPDLINDFPADISLPLNKNKFIPNPVDTEHFKREKDPIEGTALYAKNWYEDSSRAESYAKKRGWSLTILNRAAKAFIPHKDFPLYLQSFEYYIDRHNIHSLSKTALEALSMGVKIVDWNGEIRTEFPRDHDPKNVAVKTINIYREILEGRI